MMRRPGLSIILATINERENLAAVLDGIRELRLPDYEVIVVDDGSRDGTRELAVEAAASDGRTRVVLNSSRQTLSTAQFQGIMTSHGSQVVVMDSDLQHPTGAIPALLEPLRNGADLVVASRYLPGARVNGRSPYRAFLSRGAEAIARALVPPTRRVSDPLSGFFGFSRAAFEPRKPPPRGCKLLLWLLATLHSDRIAEVPYDFGLRHSGTSKIDHDAMFLFAYFNEVLSVTTRWLSGENLRSSVRPGVTATGWPAGGTSPSARADDSLKGTT